MLAIGMAQAFELAIIVLERIMSEDTNLKALTAKIVSSYVGHNSVAVNTVSDVIADVFKTLSSLEGGYALPEVAEKLVPAVPIKKSVTADAVICLECGKPQKMLKRHINTGHGLSVDEYKAKWGLPSDYPVVAPNYAAARSVMAKKIGLGHSRKR